MGEKLRRTRVEEFVLIHSVFFKVSIELVSGDRECCTIEEHAESEEGGREKQIATEIKLDRFRKRSRLSLNFASTTPSTGKLDIA